MESWKLQIREAAVKSFGSLRPAHCWLDVDRVREVLRWDLRISSMIRTTTEQVESAQIRFLIETAPRAGSVSANSRPREAVFV